VISCVSLTSTRVTQLIDDCMDQLRELSHPPVVGCAHVMGVSFSSV
jgi:hypothetical protein